MYHSEHGVQWGTLPLALLELSGCDCEIARFIFLQTTKQAPILITFLFSLLTQTIIPRTQ